MPFVEKIFKNMKKVINFILKNPFAMELQNKKYSIILIIC